MLERLLSYLPNGETEVYQLKSIGIHTVTLRRGHYGALIKDKNGVWQIGNNAKVGVASERQLEEGLKKGYIYIL